MRRPFAVLVAAVAAMCVLVLPVRASTPNGGTISKAKRSLKWTGGPFYASDPAPDPVSSFLGLGIYAYSPSCHTDNLCDHFSVRMSLGDNAKVQIKITTAHPNPPGTFAGVDSLQPVTGDDYDVYVYDPNGTLVSGDHGATEKGNETVTITHSKQFNGKPYDIAVRPWAVSPGSTYSGAVQVQSAGL